MTALPPTPMAMHDCPICRLAALRASDDRGDYAFTCAHCGDFRVSDAALVLVEALPAKCQEALVHAVRRDVAQAEAVRITVQNLSRLIAPYL